MKAIYTVVNDKKTFIGKHIGESIVREFSFASAVLWKNESLSFDKKLLRYAEDNKVKLFIFSDSLKKKRLKMDIKSVIDNGSDGHHGAGQQWYIPMGLMDDLKGYVRTAYIRDEVII